MKFNNDSFSLEYVMVAGNPWSKGKEAALMIGYQDTFKAVRIHVDDEDKIKLDDLLKTRCVSMGPLEERVLTGTRKTPFMSMRAVSTA